MTIILYNAAGCELDSVYIDECNKSKEEQIKVIIDDWVKTIQPGDYIKFE